MTNILIALKNLFENPIRNISEKYLSSNRINNVGQALEIYIKDAFCNSFEFSEKDKNKKYSENFSYLGNQNNPPDIIIKNGDAIEVKKIESLKSAIALNSSYPKDKIFSDSLMITKSCRECEVWKEKDLIYVIGSVKDNKLNSLWLVYGNCYSAKKEIYERIRNKISSGINQLEGVEFSKTKELGRINKVDPLGITNMRIRGMWHIDNPMKVFNYLLEIKENDKLNVNALILKEKYLSFPKKDRDNLEKLSKQGLEILDVKIKNPNNPAKLIDVKLIKFEK